jgi:hypothetical protein
VVYTEQDVARLRTLWPTVIPALEEQLQIVSQAMLDAETSDQWRILQGKGKVWRAMLTFPEQIAARIVAPEKE